MKLFWPTGKTSRKSLRIKTTIDKIELFSVSWLLKRLLGPLDDFVLQFFAEIVEMIAVAGDADDQVFGLFRVLLRVKQRGAVDHVELDMMPVKAEIGADQRRHAAIKILVEKRMFSSHSSLRSELVIAISADFVALYKVWYGIGENTIPDAVLAM